MIVLFMGRKRLHIPTLAALTLLVVMAFTLGLPFHLSHDHHHSHPPTTFDFSSIDHEHERHDIADHDWDGLRARLQQDDCLPADTGYILPEQHPYALVLTAEIVSIPNGACLGPPQYRAPPSV
jgi:hypothetical protein